MARTRQAASTQEQRVADYFAARYAAGHGIRISRLDDDLLVADWCSAFRLRPGHSLFHECKIKTLPVNGQELLYRWDQEPYACPGLTELWSTQTSTRGRTFRLSPWCYDLGIETGRLLTPSVGWPVLVDRILCDLVDTSLDGLNSYRWFEGRVAPGFPLGPVLVVNRQTDLVIAVLMPLWNRDVAQLFVPPDPMPPASAAEEVA